MSSRAGSARGPGVKAPQPAGTVSGVPAKTGRFAKDPASGGKDDQSNSFVGSALTNRSSLGGSSNRLKSSTAGNSGPAKRTASDLVSGSGAKNTAGRQGTVSTASVKAERYIGSGQKRASNLSSKDVAKPITVEIRKPSSLSNGGPDRRSAGSVKQASAVNLARNGKQAGLANQRGASSLTANGSGLGKSHVTKVEKPAEENTASKTKRSKDDDNKGQMPDIKTRIGKLEACAIGAGSGNAVDNKIKTNLVAQNQKVQSASLILNKVDEPALKKSDDGRAPVRTVIEDDICQPHKEDVNNLAGNAGKEQVEVTHDSSPNKMEMETWTVEMVVQFLRQEGLSDCEAVIRKKNVDGQKFLDLTDGCLQLWSRELKIMQIRKLSRLVKRLKEERDGGEVSKGEFFRASLNGQVGKSVSKALDNTNKFPKDQSGSEAQAPTRPMVDLKSKPGINPSNGRFKKLTPHVSLQNASPEAEILHTKMDSSHNETLIPNSSPIRLQFDVLNADKNEEQKSNVFIECNGVNSSAQKRVSGMGANSAEKQQLAFGKPTLSPKPKFDPKRSSGGEVAVANASKDDIQSSRNDHFEMAPKIVPSGKLSDKDYERIRKIRGKCEEQAQTLYGNLEAKAHASVKTFKTPEEQPGSASNEVKQKPHSLNNYNHQKDRPDSLSGSRSIGHVSDSKAPSSTTCVLAKGTVNQPEIKPERTNSNSENNSNLGHQNQFKVWPNSLSVGQTTSSPTSNQATPKGLEVSQTQAKKAEFQATDWLGGASAAPKHEAAVNQLFTALPEELTDKLIIKDELDEFQWYQNIDRRTAQQVVKQCNREGAFLVRPSKHGGQDSPYTLTVSSQGQIYNINIRVRSDGLYAIGREKPDEMTYDSVAEMVFTHQDEPIRLTSSDVASPIQSRTTLSVSPPKMMRRQY